VPTAGHHPNQADMIDIRHWLARQDGRIPNTPSYLVDWLHQLIATLGTDTELTRLAGLAHPDEHRRRFAALLDAAVEDGWASHNLNGEELFERYAHDEQFRAELHAAAGIAVYTATRADTAEPSGTNLAGASVAPRRQQVLINAIEDHAPRYHVTIGSPARYIAEAHVPGGATSAESDWIAYYIAAHPDVLHGPACSPADVDARSRAAADGFDREALSAFESGDHQRALDLIDEAELHDPHRDWAAVRAHVRHHMNPTIPAGSAPSGTGPAAPTAGTAFPHPRQVGEETPEPSAAATAAASTPLRGAHR
jgi:hypothetical protein